MRICPFLSLPSCGQPVIMSARFRRKPYPERMGAYGFRCFLIAGDTSGLLRIAVLIRFFRSDGIY